MLNHSGLAGLSWAGHPAPSSQKENAWISLEQGKVLEASCPQEPSSPVAAASSSFLTRFQLNEGYQRASLEPSWVLGPHGDKGF